ncbi:MAG: hypothetical protein IJN36_06580 [Clostridia bacterium]|nr:hypothetical protein [Clostridia bacterium]
MKKEIALLVALTGMNVALGYIGKKVNENYVQKKCTEQMKKELRKERKVDVHNEGMCWNLKMPVPYGREHMKNIRNILYSLRSDYIDYITINFQRCIESEAYGTATYIQATRRKEAYQIELHFEDDDDNMRQFARFVPDLNNAMKIFEQVLVKGIIPDMSKWFEFGNYIFAKADSSMKAESIRSFYDVTPEELEHLYDNAETEEDLADLLKQIGEHCSEAEDCTYDYETDTQEYISARELADKWWDLFAKVEQDIFNILKSEGVEISERGHIKDLNTFMNRNGYNYRSGWWQKRE